MVFSIHMVIEIDNDIIIAAAKGNTTAVDCLNALATAVNNKHCVYMPQWGKLSANEKNGLQSQLGTRNYNLISSVGEIVERRNTASKIARNVKIKAKYTLSQHTKFVKNANNASKKEDAINIIYLNPQENTSFNFGSETHVLSENQTDVDFYKYVLVYFLNQYVKGSVTSSVGYNCYKVGGHGGNTKTTAQQYIDEGTHFCITLGDADKHYPDASEGKTSKGIKNAYTNINPFNSWYYIMQRTSEIENLIPAKILNKLKNFDKTILISKL